MPVADRPPTGNLVELRRWLLDDPAHAAAWTDDLLSPSDVVREYPAITRSIGTLANLRAKGRGPAYVVLPAGIHYRRLAILDYIESNTIIPQRKA
jgi:hypothetical protein